MIIVKKPNTAAQASQQLLAGTGLTEWHTGFLSIALNELADFKKQITARDCILELTQMNHRHADAISAILHALTGMEFTLTFSGPYGDKAFYIDHHASTPTATQQTQIQQLHRSYGWGTKAHIHALSRHIPRRSATAH